MADTAWPASVGRGERREEGPRRLGLKDAQEDLGDDPDHPFAADEHPEQVVARRIEDRASQVHDAPVAEDEPRPEDVIGREPVF